MTQPLLRFGIHDFLNARPLILPLMEKGASMGFQIEIDSPAALADKLKLDGLDLAMIPSLEYFKSADSYRLVPNICIASRGQVASVLLVAKKPLDEISSIAVDIRSRTSVALLKILFPFRKDLAIHPLPPDPELMLVDHSAALIIGDLALTLDYSDPALKIYDLSEEWFLQTGKTFVHAVVAVRSCVELSNTQKDFIQNTKVEGLREISEIIRAHKGLLEIDPNVLEDYLINKIKYDLDEDAIDGLTHFSNLCYENGTIPKNLSIQFI